MIMYCSMHSTARCTQRRCLDYYRSHGYSWPGMPSVDRALFSAVDGGVDLAYNAVDGGVDLVVGEVEIAPGVEIGYDVTTGEEVLEVGGVIVEEW